MEALQGKLKNSGAFVLLIKHLKWNLNTENY